MDLVVTGINELKAHDEADKVEHTKKGYHKRVLDAAVAWVRCLGMNIRPYVLEIKRLGAMPRSGMFPTSPYPKNPYMHRFFFSVQERAYI